MPLGNKKRLAPARLESAAKDSGSCGREISPEKNNTLKRSNSISPPKQQRDKNSFQKEGNPSTQVMLKRWITELSKNMPAHDASDAMEEKVIGCKKRQFAPEYSHKCYLTMLREE